MTPRDQEAFDLYQATKTEPRAVAESLLDQFFDRIRADEYEEIQRRVTEIVSCVSTETSTSPSSLPSLDRF